MYIHNITSNVFVVHICSCVTFQDRSSNCFNYATKGINSFNQSNQITTALTNFIDIVNGSYCRERIIEFLCEYLFPQCDSDTNIIPICEQSCDEYLITGNCADHMHNVLIAFNATDYSNVSVDKLLQNDCSPPLDVKVSTNCTALTGGHAW